MVGFDKGFYRGYKLQRCKRWLGCGDCLFLTEANLEDFISPGEKCLFFQVKMVMIVSRAMSLSISQKETVSLGDKTEISLCTHEYQKTFLDIMSLDMEIIVPKHLFLCTFLQSYSAPTWSRSAWSLRSCRMPDIKLACGWRRFQKISWAWGNGAQRLCHTDQYINRTIDIKVRKLCKPNPSCWDENLMALK